MHFRHLGHDLVEGRIDETVELDFHHRPVAAEGQADGGAHDAGFRERGVHHPRRAEVLLQTVGNPEDPAEPADVLTHDQDLRVLLHGAAQTGGDGLAKSHAGHERVSSPAKPLR